jgi:hypothetical protein
MKRSFLILLSLFIFFSALPTIADSWDDFNDVDKMWDGQKSITNKEFEDTINSLEANKKKKEAKQRKKKIKKISGGGTSLHDELNPDNDIKEVQQLKPNEENFLINVPVKLILGNNIIEPGFYKIISNKDEQNVIHLQFYQSQFLKGEVEGTETNDDFDEEYLDFARLTPYNQSFMKLIFGTINYNAYAYIPYCSE